MPMPLSHTKKARRMFSAAAHLKRGFRMKHLSRMIPLLVLAALSAIAPSAQARLTQLVIERVQPFAGGMRFGEVGAYEHISGVARGELDKNDPHNKGIVNLGRTRINIRGKVEYEVDFEMLRPAEAARGNRKILYEVNNRGRKFMLPWLLDAPVQAVNAANDLANVKDVGTGLFFRQGWTMVWSGWDPDAPRSNKGMAMRAIVTLDNGQPIVRTIREELVSGTRVALDKWVSSGKTPPASQVPTLATRTLVAPDATGFPELPGAQVARFGNKLELFGDWKNPQPDAAKAYTTLVSKVDPDGNELAGIRLPDIAAPLATHTGWNMYKPPFTEGELCDRDGSYFAFAKTRAERAASGDPRPALEERYAGQADYVNKVIKAASALVKARLLLQEDAEAYAQAATRRRILD